MPLLDSLIGPIASIIDKIIPDKEARAKAKLELIRLEGTQDMQMIEARLQAIVAEANSTDPSMGVLAAFNPSAARDIAAGMNAYLNGLPEPLYALFGTGYLGYTAARQWGKK